MEVHGLEEKLQQAKADAERRVKAECIQDGCLRKPCYCDKHGPVETYERGRAEGEEKGRREAMAALKKHRCPNTAGPEYPCDCLAEVEDLIRARNKDEI
jgi:hypothetical protein